MIDNPMLRLEVEFLLQTVFNHVPSGRIPCGDFAGEEYDEFWWRESLDRDGYVVVWYDGTNFSAHHTYILPNAFV